MSKFFHRILLAALTSALLVPLAAQAQQQDPAPGDPSQNSAQPNGTQRRERMAGSQHMAMLAEKLHLTDAQKEQFQQIGKDTRHQGMAIRRDSSLTADQKKEKMLALRKQAHQQMFAILTPEQKDQLKQMRDQHKKDQGKNKSAGDQAAAKPGTGGATAEDDDPFAGMTNDDDDGSIRGSF
jgi:Spy/CpxP family protein refolding chaperone